MPSNPPLLLLPCPCWRWVHHQPQRKDGGAVAHARASASASALALGFATCTETTRAHHSITSNHSTATRGPGFHSCTGIDNIRAAEAAAAVTTITMSSGATPHFVSQPFRYMRYASHAKPAIFWSVMVGLLGPVILVVAPPTRAYFGDGPRPRVPMTYPRKTDEFQPCMTGGALLM